MRNEVRARSRVGTFASSNATRPTRRTKDTKIYGGLPKTASQSTAIIQVQPKLRITPVMQAQILRLYMEGCSLSEISRRTHRARQTVTKVVRAPDVQAKLKEVKAILLGEADAWAESINYAVTHETDAALAYRLLQDFGVIPSPEKEEQPQPPHNVWHNDDLENMLRAKILGEEALRRGHPMSMEREELEKLTSGTGENDKNLSLAPK